MERAAVHVWRASYVCSLGDDADRCLERFIATLPGTAAPPIGDEVLGVPRRLRSQLSRHAVLAVVAARRCLATLPSDLLEQMAVCVACPTGAEVARPFLDAVGELAAAHPSPGPGDVFRAAGVNVLDFVKLTSGTMAGHIAKDTGIHGPNACFTGRNAGFFALHSAANLLMAGRRTWAMVLGGESSIYRGPDERGAELGVALLLSLAPPPQEWRHELVMDIDREQPALVGRGRGLEALGALVSVAWLLETMEPNGRLRALEQQSLQGPPLRFGIRSTARPRCSMRQRVVITACGVVSPIGDGLEEFGRRLIAGESGAARLDAAFGETWRDLPVSVGAPVPERPRRLPRSLRDDPHTLDRSASFAAAALSQIVAPLQPMLEATAVPLYAGVGIGQLLPSFEDAVTNARRSVADRNDGVASDGATLSLARALGLGGWPQTFNGACSASTQACIQACEDIGLGMIDVAVAGGHDSLLSIAGLLLMSGLGTLSGHDEPRRAVRPFDCDRDGTMIGEGATYFLFEALDHALVRDAPILAEVVGFGSSLDGYHVTSPDPSGRAGIQMIRDAIEMASITPAAIDYVNAHGTATILNDITEAQIIRSALDSANPYVSSSKPQFGHLIAACGAIELAACVVALQMQRVPPNINLERLDPECDLCIPAESVSAPIEYVLSNSFGFGGQNTCMLLRRWRAETRR